MKHGLHLVSKWYNYVFHEKKKKASHKTRVLVS